MIYILNRPALFSFSLLILKLLGKRMYLIAISFSDLDLRDGSLKAIL